MGEYRGNKQKFDLEPYRALDKYAGKAKLSKQERTFMSETFDASVDVSVENPEVAETEDNVVAEAEVVEDASEVEDEGVDEQESTEPAFDKNAIAAAARREAEAKLKERDAEFTRRFGHLKNPITGKSIQSEKDYFDALDAQETLKRNRELKEKGIDPTIIDRAIANNPVVRQAEQVIAQNQQQIIANDIENQVKMISQLDPSIKTFSDLESIENKDALLEMVQKGYSLYDAYRLANYDNLMSRKSAAAQQKAVNQAKGKSHLTPTTSGANTNDGLYEIPESALDKWKAFFPDASMKELKEKYNRSLKLH